MVPPLLLLLFLLLRVIRPINRTASLLFLPLFLLLFLLFLHTPPLLLCRSLFSHTPALNRPPCCPRRSLLSAQRTAFCFQTLTVQPLIRLPLLFCPLANLSLLSHNLSPLTLLLLLLLFLCPRLVQTLSSVNIPNTLSISPPHSHPCLCLSHIQSLSHMLTHKVQKVAHTLFSSRTEEKSMRTRGRENKQNSERRDRRIR